MMFASLKRSPYKKYLIWLGEGVWYFFWGLGVVCFSPSKIALASYSWMERREGISVIQSPELLLKAEKEGL